METLLSAADGDSGVNLHLFFYLVKSRTRFHFRSTNIGVPVGHNPARTPKLLATGPRIPNARTDALPDQIALKLGNGRDHTRTDE